MRLRKLLLLTLAFYSASARLRQINPLTYFILRLRRVNLFLLFCFSLLHANDIKAQDYNFAWVNNPGSGTELEEAVQFINDSTDAKFVLFTGGFSDFSDSDDFEAANTAIENLGIPYYITPGNSDVQYSGSRNDFLYTFDDDRFTFEFENEIFIGLSSAIHWRGEGGHIYPEDLAWLKDELDNIRINKNIYLVVSNPMDERTDNWFQITDLIKDYNVQAILCGSGTENKLLNINQIPGLINKPLITNEDGGWNFTSIHNTPDSLFIFDVDSANNPARWMYVTKNINPLVAQIDSIQFNNFGNEIIFDSELNTTMIAQPVFFDGKIYTADFLGLITCYDTVGNVLWDYDSYGNIISDLTVADNILIAATLQGDLITLEALTGEQIQTIGFDDEITSALATIEFAGTNNLLLPKYSQSKAAVVLGTSTGKLYCYDLETLQEYWVNTSASGRIITKPLYINNKIIYGAMDGYLYCIDAREGWLIWKWSAGKDMKQSPAGCQPVSDGKNVYVTTTEEKVYAIDLQLGKTVWQTNKFASWESIGINKNKDRILVKTTDGKLNIVETRKGKNRKTVNLKSGKDKTPSAPLAWDGNILVPSGNGYIYKIDNNFNVEEILFMGTAAINSFENITENIFIASNIDGRVILFKIN